MFRLVVALSVLCVVRAALEDSDDRVVNGETASIMEFPYQVSLQQHGRHFCGGSIINQQWILTAAHCLQPVIAANAISSLTCRAGSSSSISGGTLKSIEQAYVHENYIPPNMNNDIAVAKIMGQLVYSATIKPVRFLTSPLSSGTPVVVSGWGQIHEYNTNLPTILNKLVMTFLSSKDCSMYHPNAITDKMVCATGPGKDSCRGDSGGPLNVQGTNIQVGVVSWGIQCGLANLPGVYVNIGHPEMRKFIERFVGPLQ